MHILLTNDDGIDAPGLLALRQAIAQIRDVQLSVVAPPWEQSMCGHTVKTHEPIVVEQVGPDRWTAGSSPADCVRIALFGLGLRPDWVLSGINAGGNMGQDVAISGTVAAAREACYHGVKSIAFSHYLIKGIAMDWARAGQWAAGIFESLRTERLADGEFWNANLPHLQPGSMDMPAVRHCEPARSPLNVAYEARAVDQARLYRYTAIYAERPRDAGSDVEACFGGAISISKLRVV